MPLVLVLKWITESLIRFPRGYELVYQPMAYLQSYLGTEGVNQPDYNNKVIIETTNVFVVFI